MITHRMLKSKGACESQVSLFKRMFPDGAPLTVETAVSVADKFNFSWAIYNLLSVAGKAAYEEARAPLLAAYEEARAPLLAAYEEARAPLLAAYKEAREPLWAAYVAYKEASEPLWAANRPEAVAKAFAELYIKENTTYVNKK